MKVAIAQLNYTVGDIDGNKKKIIEAIGWAKEKSAELVLFSEAAVCGTPVYDLIRKRPFLEDCAEALQEIVNECDGIAALVGTLIRTDNGAASVGAFIENRKLVKYIGKKNVYKSYELPNIKPSAGGDIITVGGKQIAVLVGEDLLIESEFGNKTEMIVAIYADRYCKMQIAQRYDYFKNLAYETNKTSVLVNHLGGQTDWVYDGSSCIFNSKKEGLGFLKSFEEELFVFDTENPTVVEEPAQDVNTNIFKAIKLGLRDYFDKNGFGKACLGLSGGIDSAVVLAMAVEALGADRVRVLMLPSQFSSGHSVDDSVQMAEALGVEYNIIPIKDTFDSVVKAMEPVNGGLGFDVTEENIQSRVRAVMLMALANKHNCILLNTTNKSEAAVGYGTMYGDSAGAIGAIADLYKIEVYSLARYINREREIIPWNIIHKEPSAELRPDQRDSDSLPPYEILDAILFRFIEEGQYLDEVVDAGFDYDVADRVRVLLKRSEYKRYQSCPALRLSTCAFGSCFRLPLTNKYKY